jgi:chorismate lyase/3-hydroxybenzoate synthase
VWNTVARINRLSVGEERYRLFCKGRAEAYAGLWGEGFERRLPSCSAVGSQTGGLSVQLLAGSRPGTSIENPRQVSAYRYPDLYGPRSPSFARGLVAPNESGGWIFVSGTASIVGHESVHLGDPVAQTEETMRNVEEVLDEGDCPGVGGPLGARLRALRVYVRRREDVAPIRETLDRILGSPVPTVWLLADVCREELLVEIEGIGRGHSAFSATS